jgi:hypothetical protein
LSDDAAEVDEEPAEDPAPPPVCAIAAGPLTSTRNVILRIAFVVIDLCILLLPFQRNASRRRRIEMHVAAIVEDTIAHFRLLFTLLGTGFREGKILRADR